MKYKDTLISNIITVLNDPIKQDNTKLCQHNLHSQQKPLHGANMFLTLAFMGDRELIKIATACGI